MLKCMPTACLDQPYSLKLTTSASCPINDGLLSLLMRSVVSSVEQFPVGCSLMMLVTAA